MTDRYASYRETLLSIGADPAEVEVEIARNVAEDEKLDQGECPTCSNELKIGYEGSTRGASIVPGSWVSYFCPSCKFVCSRKESIQ